MAVNAQVKPNDLKVIATLKGYLSDGLTLAEMGEIEGVSKQAMSNRLKKYHLKTSRSNKKLSREQSQVKGASQPDQPVNLKPPKKIDKRKKKKPPVTPPPLNDPDPDDDPDDEKAPDINPQIKEIIDVQAYAETKLEKCNLGNIITIYKETKMLENEDKDFADDNAFLGNVESMLFQYKIIEAQSPALDVRVENPDLVEEGI